MLSVTAQCEGLWLESQAGVPDLSAAGTEFAHQAKEVLGTREAEAAGRTNGDQPSMVNVIDAFKCEALDIEIHFSLPFESVYPSLKRSMEYQNAMTASIAIDCQNLLQKRCCGQTLRRCFLRTFSALLPIITSC